MTATSRRARVLWTLASLVLCTGCPPVFGGVCAGGNPQGPNPPNCGPTSIAAVNVDCSFCCKRSGQSCTQAENQGLTTTDPCCSGSCTDAGVCACGGTDADCASDADCCSGFACALDHHCAAVDGGFPPSGLGGAAAFAVTSALEVPSLAACGTCGTAADGNLQATAIVLSDRDVSGAVCPPADGGLAGAVRVVEIQVVGAGYAGCNPAGTVGAGELVPGTYPILDEGVEDEDVCGNIPASEQAPLAILTYELCGGDGGSGCATSYWARGGSVTLSAATAAGASGSFDVFLRGLTVPDAGELTGTFGAPVCR